MWQYLKNYIISIHHIFWWCFIFSSLSVVFVVAGFKTLDLLYGYFDDIGKSILTFLAGLGIIWMFIAAHFRARKM